MSSGEGTTPFGSRSPGSPVSLKGHGSADPDDRRVFSGSTANAAPDNALDYSARKAVGYATHNRRWLHVVVETSGGDSTWSLYLWSEIAGRWCLDTRLGTNGVVSTIDGDPDNPQTKIVEIAGVDRVYLQVTPGGGSSASAWLGTSGLVDAG